MTRLPQPAPLRVPRAPSAPRWSRVELRAEVVSTAPALSATVAGFASLIGQLGIGDHPLEEVWVAAVDAHFISAIALVARGVHARVEVALPAVLAVPLLAGTNRLVLVHTHPGGSTEPSSDDLVLTRNVVAAANAAGLVLADHLIVARGGAISSLRDRVYLEVP
jgi:hypothetical protein